MSESISLAKNVFPLLSISFINWMIACTMIAHKMSDYSVECLLKEQFTKYGKYTFTESA